MKLLAQVKVVARRRRLAQNTIDVYSLWIRQFLAFSAQQLGGWKPPQQLGTGDVEALLNDLGDATPTLCFGAEPGAVRARISL